MTYIETLEWLFSQLPAFQRIGKAAYKANLDNTYALMELLGHPHLKFKSIHIAGTNGKGSTAHILASIYQEAGYKTALYTSPHLRDFRERIRVNGQMISQDEVIDFVQEHKEAFETIKPSFFEMTVGMAFDYFAREKVDIAIIETGLGGRLDSTNILFPELSIITNIGKDHMQFLGNSLREIATEKAGIIKKDTAVIIGKHQEETDDVFLDKAREFETELFFAQDIFEDIVLNNKHQLFKKGIVFLEDLNVPLMGNYQKENIQTAVASADYMKIPIQFIKTGLEKVVNNTSFMGRWQVLSNHPLCIADTAHNYEGLAVVMQQLKSMEYNQLHIVLGVVDDKELENILVLFPRSAQYYFCKADIPRGLDADKLASIANDFQLIGKKYSSVNEALKEARGKAFKNDLIFIGGSTFTVAEVV